MGVRSFFDPHHTNFVLPHVVSVRREVEYSWRLQNVVALRLHLKLQTVQLRAVMVTGGRVFPWQATGFRLASRAAQVIYVSAELAVASWGLA